MNPSLTIVSINTRGTPLWVRGFTARYRALAAAVADLNADVVQCQEVLTWWHLRLLRSQLPAMPCVGYSRGVAGPRGGVVTFSRRPIGRCQYLPFRRPTGPTLAALPRRSRLTLGLHGVLSARHLDTGLLLINVHTSANSDGDWSPGSRFGGLHRAQLSQLAEQARSVDGPVLVSGDLNTAADSVFYREFQHQLGAVDAFTADERPTFRPEFLPPGRSAHRIDYVFTAGNPQPQVTAADVVLADAPALSDHYGLRVTVEC